MSPTDVLIHILLILAAMSQGLAVYAAFSTLHDVQKSTERLEQSFARQEHYLAQSLERIVNATDRTEQMTQRLLLQTTPRQY